MTAANDLGLTTAVPARMEVLVDARLRPIRLGNLEVRFAAAPERLYWAGPWGKRGITGAGLVPRRAYRRRGARPGTRCTPPTRWPAPRFATTCGLGWL